TNAPVNANAWQHLAAVFEEHVPYPGTTYFTNQMRIYLNGQMIASNYTSIAPFRDLDPAYSPGVSLGCRSRYDNTQPYRGFMDEMTVYARALTDPEIIDIYALGRLGKADTTVPPALSLSKLRVRLDGVDRLLVNGDNAKWDTYTLDFAGTRTNMVL